MPNLLKMRGAVHVCGFKQLCRYVFHKLTQDKYAEHLAADEGTVVAYDTTLTSADLASRSVFVRGSSEENGVWGWLEPPAGATMDDVVATQVHMVNLDDFEAMNVVYAEYFKKNPPGRTTVGVTSLPAGAAVEITATAYVGE